MSLNKDKEISTVTWNQHDGTTLLSGTSKGVLKVFSSSD